MPEKSEQEKFLESVVEESVLDQPLVPEKEEEEETKTEEPEQEEEKEEAKNRRERRLLERLQAEKESNIALNARLQALSEVKQFRENTPEADYLKKVERIYGTNSPEAQEATNLLSEALRGVEERATERALERFREEQEKAQRAVQEEEKQLESFVDSIEDEFNTSLSKADQQGFFRLLEKVSPKDSDGNIIAYADPLSTWELYQEKKQPKDSRAKDLASRSMTASGASSKTSVEDDATARTLREWGIIN